MPIILYLFDYITFCLIFLIIFPMKLSVRNTKRIFCRLGIIQQAKKYWYFRESKVDESSPLLTQLLLDRVAVVLVDVALSTEEVLVDVRAAEDPHVGVIRHDAVDDPHLLEARALSLRLARRNHVRKTEQGEKLLKYLESNNVGSMLAAYSLRAGCTWATHGVA